MYIFERGFYVFYDNLKIICDQKGVKITPIVAECGGAKGSISNWKNGASPNSDIVAKLAVRLNVSSDELIFGKETSPSLPEDELELLGYYKKLPEREKIRLVSRAEALADVYAEKVIARQEITMMTNINIYTVAAGAGVSVPFREDDNYVVRSFPQTDVPTNADCGIYINGKSMEPRFPDGCIVWIDRKREVNYGDPIIAILDGEPYCKIYQPDGLHSINPDFKTIKVCESDSCKIFGKVIGFYAE